MRFVVARWTAVIAATTGMIFSNGPVMQFTFGVFMGPLTREFGVTRADVSVALTVGMTAAGFSLLVVGWLIDRYGTRSVTPFAIILFAAALLFAAHAATLSAFILAFAFIGLFGAGQSPLPYSRVIARRFDKKRGLALGIAMTGGGLGGITLPAIAAYVIQEVSWRAAYMTLALLMLCIALPAAIIALGEERPADVRASGVVVPGMSFKEAVSSYPFWLLAISFTLSTLSASAVLTYSVPILVDTGIDQTRAVTAISTFGVSMIIGRLLSGYLVDRHSAAWVTAGFFAGQTLGVAMLVGGLTMGAITLPFAIAASALVGLGLGAEIDLLGYLLSKMFGFRSFGLLYGVILAFLNVSGGGGQQIVSWAYSRFGNYTSGMIIIDGGLILAVVLALLLDRPLRTGQVYKAG
jgi:MFS family permease